MVAWPMFHVMEVAVWQWANLGMGYNRKQTGGYQNSRWVPGRVGSSGAGT
jgi:hypothetical protein